MVESAGHPGERPAAPDSPLASLRERRERAKKKLHLDLFVPRYEPPVVVRYQPIARPVLTLANKRAAELAEKKDPDATVIGNAVALTHACLGVYDASGKELQSIDPSGEPPRFDERLARLLELPDGATAVDVVRALYMTDGDIIAAVSEVSEWSAIAERRQAEDLEGN